MTGRGGAHAVVVGGGITGLAAAWRLVRPAPGPSGLRPAPWPRVTVLEAAPRLGGKIRTVSAGPVRVEAGPDSFLARKRALADLAEELGVASLLRGMGPRRGAFILHGGRLHPVPAGLRGIVPTDADAVRSSTLLSEAGKERVLAEAGRPAGDVGEPGTAGRPDNRPVRDPPDESLGSLSRRHFGDEWTERLVEPLFAGIHAASADRLSLRATHPELPRWEREWGSLIRAARESGASGPPVGRRPAGVPDSPFLSFEGGLETLVTVLADALGRAGVRIVTGAPVARVVPAVRGGYRVELAGGEAETADAVILAVPAHAAAGILESLNADAARALATIPFASTAAVALAYPRADVPALSGTGFVVPRGQGLTITACTDVAAKWPHLVPAGMALLRCFVGRRDEEEALAEPDDALEERVRRDLKDVLGVAAAPAWSAVFRWPLGFPQYDTGHLERVAAVERALAVTPGLAVAGASYRGLGLPDCVEQGFAAYRPPASDQ